LRLSLNRFALVKKTQDMPKPKVFLFGLIHAYQWLESPRPSLLEREQRRKFTDRILQEIQNFQPNIIADETPDTDNVDLLAALPSAPIPIDIPDARKQQRGLSVQRSMHFVCPFVDSIRERYWRYRLHCLSKSQPEPRILMMIGALHLNASFERISFTDLLTRAGYDVATINMYTEPGWDHTWIHDWKHPIAPTTGSPPTFRCCVATGTYQRTHHCDYKTYWKAFLASKEQQVP
jgi:hypothetical protein